MIPINGSTSSLRSDFDGFLFAPVGEDSGNNGMPLSVLSALARQGVDPWEEADRLACLPSETAIQRLTALIAALPDGPSTRLDRGAVAVRLIALLPQGGGSVIRSRTARPGVRTAAHAWPVKYIIVYWIFMLFILGAQWLAVNYLVAAQAATTAKPMSGAVVSRALPRDADQ
jgi:hypothetical protein